MKRAIKCLIRTAVYARLRWLPLSESNAAKWADRIKRWPAIFAELPFSTLVQVHERSRMSVGIVDIIERTLLVAGKWDEAIGDALSRHIRPGSTVLDVGANIGYFSLLASELVGAEGRVVCIEPCHRNLSRLAHHLWINGSSNASIVSMAAGSAPTWAELNFPTNNNAGAATLRSVGASRRQPAMVMPLDDLVDAYDLTLDVIKLDIEGYELEALRGLERTLRQQRPVVICEVTDAFLRDTGESAGSLIAYMSSLGYRAVRLGDASTGMAPPSGAGAADSGPTDQYDAVFQWGP